MWNSSVKQSARKAEKPAKPYPEFPLYAHASGRWAKKIKGRTHFFGSWADWQAAYERYQAEAPYLHAGRTPPRLDQEVLSVGDLVNLFLAHRKAKVKSGELTQRTWDDYKEMGEVLVASLGRHTSVDTLTADDFRTVRQKLAKGVGLVTLQGRIGRCRAFFNYAYDAELIAAPIRGMKVGFEKPSKQALKREKSTKPKKFFTLQELRTLYQSADRQMQCFILLALNGGLGNADIGQLEQRHIVDGWIDYPRPKTGEERLFPLWPETRRAIEDTRQTKRGDLPLVFVTKYGLPWHKDSKDRPLGGEFYKLCKACSLHEKGRGFYSLRHVFETQASGCRDQKAIDRVMGHRDPSMSGHYLERIEPERLQAVVNHVRAWAKPIWKAGRRAK